ncbi:hypothetical protein D3218_19045 [Aureimonas flava]|uniref:Uncharacterized protein n=1 Tax=Aureimonas flava TaxID=2320271 RepID=A0A3A1WGF3_9HYPH|nr:hypothetical protein [Aureimonas flava]RIX97161.1 hypothetical protein D3218_19045 [Aureimonas flava]
MEPRIQDILADLGIVVIPTARRRRPGETHAGGVMRQIVGEHGMDVLELTLRLIRGSRLNAEALSSETIGALADVLAQRPDWHSRRDDLARACEAIDLEAFRARAVARRPWPVRGFLRPLLYDAFDRHLTRRNAPEGMEMAA